jgi:amino acid adenylation domain-containing protein/thioester reductase-like protein
LDTITNRIANFLKTLGATDGKNVAILTERSEMMVILPLAVLKTGAAYVPLQHDFNSEKINKILADCKSDILLTDKYIQNYLGHIVDTNQLYNIIKKYPDTPLSNANKKTFGIFYTSGSTGQPKGVVISHRNVSAYCKWYQKFFSPSVNTVIAAYNNFAFDAFITDVFPALTSGATIAIVPQNIKTDLTALADFCNDNIVNIIDLPTQIGRLFAANKRCKFLKHIVLGGETASQITNCNNYNIYNQYGPTETTVAVSIYKISGTENIIPIGKPLDCVKIYVVDNCGKQAPIGAIGEIWIAGAQVSDGYLNDNVSNNKFVANIFDNAPDFNIVFRTGDYGRWKNDGNLEFIGRRDNLVKIRGYRVDIGELEFVLKTCQGVTDAVATTYIDAANMVQIAAYVVGKHPLNLSNIRNEIRYKLQQQILPKYLQQIDAMPITPNGKINRKQLPIPNIEAVSKTNKKPQNNLESIICETFENILNIKKISTDDNFFEIGGTSISAMQVVVALENKGYNIKYGNIFEHPTAEDLAQYLSSNTANLNIESQHITTIPKQINNTFPVKYNNISNVVLTGATGFFGAHLLLELLKNQHTNIICVIRSKDGKSATERLEYISNFYFNTSLLRKYPHRIQIVEGDLTNNNTIKILESLSIPNVAIINSAAIVKYFAEPQKMKATNVDVVKKLVEICIKKNWKYIHISTLSAATIPGSIVDEHTTCAPLPNAIPYVASKWQAEQIAINAANNGLKLILIRLGNLAARSYDGVFQINANDNATSKLIELVRKLKCYPLAIDNLHFDITPVDYAAHNVSKLICVDQYPEIFHVFNPQLVTIKDVVDAQSVTNEEFAIHTKELPTELRFLTDYLLDNTPCTWSNEYTLSVLQNIN